MLRMLLLAMALLVTAAHAGPPQRMELVYDLTRNGLKLGEVSDSFVRNGTRYTLVSTSRVRGALARLWPGTIRLESRGSVTAQGLRPDAFSHARSDAPDKLATARLDWGEQRIAWTYKGETRAADGLAPGAQDQLSQLYQFMFLPELPADYRLQVVSGRDLNDYHYASADGGTLETPLGALATRRYERVAEVAGQKSVTVWVAPARGNLPVRVRVVEDGVTVEQHLVRASIGG
ncbi:MAG: hypothetical protein BGP21_05435 [Thiobacillus sp. 65-29]|nr:MAG: hypothetical protein BGP21_05435 [Thiobacillus sp. 65-29]